MMMSRRKRVQLWRVAALLIIACCAFVVGVSVAKMVHDVQADGGELQIAKWDVTAVKMGSSNVDLMAGGATRTYTLTVTNNSEVASSYAIQVSGIPTGVKVGLDITSESGLQTPENGTITFDNTGGDLDYRSENDDNIRPHTLTLKAMPEADVTSADVEENMTINVLFEQKRPE